MTEEEKNEIKAAVVVDLKADSTDVSELPEVTDLTGINSLPAVKGTGADATLVAAPLSLLSKPATDAAASLTDTVNAKIQEFGQSVSTAVTEAGEARDAANAAATAATQATDTYETKLVDIEAAISQANDARDAANTAATTANDAAASIDDDLAAETAARQAADTTLQGNIDKRTTIISIGTWYATAADKPASPNATVFPPAYVAEEDKLYNVVDTPVEGSLMVTLSWEDAGAPSNTALYLYNGQIYYHVKKTAVVYGQASGELVAAATAAALTAETTARQSADTSLQNRIAALEAADAVVEIGEKIDNISFVSSAETGKVYLDGATRRVYEWDSTTSQFKDITASNILYRYAGYLYYRAGTTGSLVKVAKYEEAITNVANSTFISTPETQIGLDYTKDGVVNTIFFPAATDTAAGVMTAADKSDLTSLKTRVAALEASGAIVKIDYFQDEDPTAPTDGQIWCTEGIFLQTYDAANGVWNDYGTNGEPQSDTLYLYDGQLYVVDDGGELTPASGQGGNIINVTEEYPVATGYHTLATATSAVPAKRRALGRCITYETEAGRWATKQFTATALSSWTSAAAWTDFGGTVRSISVNDVPMAIDENGNVDIGVPSITVDTSLGDSTNPVQNAAVTSKFAEIEEKTLFGVDYTENTDAGTITLSFKNKAGGDIAVVDLPAGGGGGGGDSTAARIVTTATVDNAIIREGGTATLSWSYDHQYSSGDDKGVSTGQKGNITITVKNGATTLKTVTLRDVSAGTRSTLDLTDILTAGTNDIYLAAAVTDPETGVVKNKQIYTSVRVIALHLTSSYNMAGNAAGYTSGDTIEIPFVVTGSGSKTVFLCVDGDTGKTVTKTSLTSGQSDFFTLAASTLSVGIHTLTLWAEYAVDETTKLTSETVRIDLMRQGDTPAAYVAAMTTDGTGVTIGQYETATFRWFAYHPTAQPVAVTIANTATGQTQTVEVARTVQTYAERFTTQGNYVVTLTCGTATATVAVTVTEGSIVISEVELGRVLRLTAENRSNNEPKGTRETWSDSGVATTFAGMDWSSNGWTSLGGIPCLKLSNGATAALSLKPFATDFKETGYTFEVTLRVENAIDTAQPVMTCFDSGKGIQVTGDNAAFFTGQTTTYTNEDGENKTRAVQISSKYSTGKWYQITFVFGKSIGDGGNRIMELYINGNRASADQYDAGFSFLQDVPQDIVFNSDGADVYIRSIRAYSYGLTDDEVLTNRIIDAETVEKMVQLYDDNDVLDDDLVTADGQRVVSFNKLRTKGKGTLIIVRENKLVDVYATNNKKTDFAADIYYYSPFGTEYDFVLTGCNIRIQGTSSTKYPAKNIRIYLAKGPNSTTPVLTVGGEVQAKNKYAVRPGGIKMNLICLKVDYSDSSMSLNTGGAKLFNETTKALGLLTPPQQAEYAAADNDISAVQTRSAIDGVPIDVFTAATIDSTPEYVGQYNFNNEKAKSGDLFGMTGDAWACPLALEMLNNGERACLFTLAGNVTASAFDADAANDYANAVTIADTEFDSGAEVNFGKGYYYDEATKTWIHDDREVTYTDGDVTYAHLLPRYQTAIRRLYGWIASCIPTGAQYSSGETPGDIATWRSDRFRQQVADYFDLNYLLTYYLWTDYFLSVDQRAKNMILRTWDGLKWYITYYDGDTQLGKRNDCYLVYDYDTMRGTYDISAKKFAYEGANSALWNLVLANFESELQTAADALRGVLTNTGATSTTDALHIMLDEQAGNWADRTFNKSGYLKYIAPLLAGENGAYIFALQGSNEAHRRYMIANRFALLDAKYATANLRNDRAEMYISRKESAPAVSFYIKASALYAFGYGSNNATGADTHPTGLIEKGATATLTFETGKEIQKNDPQNVYGASRIDELDISDLSVYLTGTSVMNKCTSLRKIDAHCPDGATPGNFCLDVRACTTLQHIDLHGSTVCVDQQDGTGVIDLTRLTRLLTLDARSTAAHTIRLAEGAPVTTLRLPASLTILELKNLAALTPDGLTLEGVANITKFIFDGCPRLDWQTLLAQCPNVTRINVNVGTISARSEWVRSLAAGYKGVNDNLADVDLPVVKGTVQLIDYTADVDALMDSFYDRGLTIINPEYTMIEFDDTVTDDANISNLDNQTGYKYGNAYVPSGHVAKTLSRRHRVLAKVTKKATTRAVTIAGVDTTMNNLDGEATICQLDDTDSYKYAADGSAAKLDGSEGDWMMHEPFYWGKGINDFLNGKKYSCHSSNDKDNPPKSPDAVVLTLDDIKATEGGYESGKKIQTGKETLSASYTADSTYSVCKVTVAGRRRVRFPSVPGTNLVGSVFADASGNIVSSVVVSTLGGKFEAGMYIIADVPDGATELYFSILNTAEFDKVVLSDSEKIEDMEPEWVAHDECLTAVVGSSVAGEKLRACITGGSTTASMTWTDFHYYSAVRGMQQIDAEMHSRIANLFYAKYGRRDAQEQCGAGSHTSSRTTGGTASRGMQDTIGYEAASAINSGVTNSMVENLVHQYAWYEGKDSNGNATVTQVNNICCLGYEDIYGHKYDMMDGVDMPNSSGNTYKWRIWEPDGSIRWVQGKSGSGNYIAAVAHGLHEDVVPVGGATASSSTCYCDIYYVSGSAGRVVFRGCYGAHAVGGVSGADANYDATDAYGYLGSRLAFRGKIVKAASVAAFKALAEVA